MLKTKFHTKLVFISYYAFLKIKETSGTILRALFSA